MRFVRQYIIFSYFRNIFMLPRPKEILFHTYPAVLPPPKTLYSLRLFFSQVLLFIYSYSAKCVTMLTRPKSFKKCLFFCFIPTQLYSPYPKIYIAHSLPCISYLTLSCAMDFRNMNSMVTWCIN